VVLSIVLWAGLISLTLVVIAESSPQAFWTGVKPVVQTSQAFMTALALVVGGLWAYYRFGVERIGAGVVQMQIEPKFHAARGLGKGRRAAVVSISIKNVGRAQLRMQACRVVMQPVDSTLDVNMRLKSVGVVSLPQLSIRGLPLFADRESKPIDPGAELSEDVLLNFQDQQLAQIVVTLVADVETKSGFLGDLPSNVPGSTQEESEKFIWSIIMDLDAMERLEKGAGA
jgi:hypothetical protein